MLTYGHIDVEMTITDSNQTAPYKSYLYVLDEIVIVLPDYTIEHPEGGVSSVYESARVSPESERMKFAFLFDATQLLEEIEQTHQEISLQGLRKILVKVLSVSLVIAIIIMIRVRSIAKKLTNKIIRLLETLEEILYKTESGQSELSFKSSCKELNALHLTFNEVAKINRIETLKYKEGEET